MRVYVCVRLCTCVRVCTCVCVCVYRAGDEDENGEVVTCLLFVYRATPEALNPFLGKIVSCILQHTATLYNTLQHSASHCNTLQHTATHCNTLLHTATRCVTLQHTATHCNTLQYTALHCNTLQHITTHHNTLQLPATHYSMMQHTYSATPEAFHSFLVQIFESLTTSHFQLHIWHSINAYFNTYLSYYP